MVQGKDRLVGGNGGDRLKGSGGKDRTKGSKGKDRLAGGKGGDRLNAVDRKKDRTVNGDLARTSARSTRSICPC